MDGHHSAPGLCVLPAEHGRHDVTACDQHRPVGRQHAPWMAQARIGEEFGEETRRRTAALSLCSSSKLGVLSPRRSFRL